MEQAFKSDSHKKRIIFNTTSKILIILVIATIVLYKIKEVITVDGFLELAFLLPYGITLVIITVMFHEPQNPFDQKLIKAYATSKISEK